MGLNYALARGYVVSANIANNTLNGFTPSNEVQTAQFNTPKNRYNLTFTKRATNDSKIGFSANLKHQDEFIWESGFVQPSETGIPFFSNTTVPAINNLDAQVNYKLTSMKSVIKVGATNLFGTPYIQAYGNPSIGSMYYVGITFDQLSQ